MNCRVFTVSAFLVAGGSWPASADVINMPGHLHGPSPITTFGVGPPNQHQHRTGHNPAGGGGGHGARDYQAAATWMNNTYHDSVDGHPAFGHGHMDAPARYAVHTAVAGGQITAATAALWNANATQRAFEAFNGVDLGGGHVHGGWNPVGNASGARNFPGTDNDEAPAPANGLPWHSTVNFLLTNESQAHDFHIRLVDPSDPQGTTALGEWDFQAGGVGSRAGLNVLINANPIANQDVDWHFGTSDNTAVDGDKYDLATVMLHETGHTLGFLHFGNRAMGDIMDITNVNGLGLRGAAGNILHTISPPTVHGVGDLYAVVVPLPPAVALGGMGLLMVVGAWFLRGRVF